MLVSKSDSIWRCFFDGKLVPQKCTKSTREILLCGANITKMVLGNCELIDK